MGDRTALGSADVSDERLAAMVAALLRVDEAALLDSRVDPVDYDLPTITTGGRWWVSGHVAVQGERVPFRFFVKLVQAWERSPYFQFVPEEMREIAAAGVPWRTEPEVYRSDVAARLPDRVHAPPRPRRARPRRALLARSGSRRCRRGPRRGTGSATSAPPTCSADSPAARRWRR